MPRLAHAHAPPSAPRPLQTTSATQGSRGLANVLQKVRNTSDRSFLHSSLQACVAGAASLDAVRLDTRICNARIQALGSARNIAGARAVFDQVPLEARDLATYDAMVTAYLQVKDWQGAMGIVQGMLQPDALVPPDEAIFVAMMEALGNAGQPERAVALFREMPKVGLPYDWCSAAAAMRGRARAGDANGTIELLRQMQDTGVRVDECNYNIAIEACGHEPDLYQALALLDEMRQSDGLDTTVRSFNATLHVCARAGCLEKALRLHREMQERGLRPNRDTDVALAAAHVGSGDIDGAIELIETKLHRPDVGAIRNVLRGFRDSRAAARWLASLFEIKTRR